MHITYRAYSIRCKVQHWSAFHYVLYDCSDQNDGAEVTTHLDVLPGRIHASMLHSTIHVIVLACFVLLGFLSSTNFLLS